MLNVTFLGANGSLQDRESGNTALLVEGREGRFAIDLSGGLPELLEADVDGVVLTHEHIDHVYALPSLLHQLWLSGRTRPLELWMPAGVKPLAEGMIGLFGLREKKGMLPIWLHTEDTFRVGSLSVTLFPTDHTEHSVGVTVEEAGSKLVYTCDTRPIRTPPPCMAGARILIHEASGLAQDEERLIRKGHSSGRDAAMLAQALNVKTLYLCHLPQSRQAKEAILREARSLFKDTMLPPLFHKLSTQ